MNKYDNLERICGGMITAKRLETFRRAIPEFHLFVEEMQDLLAPEDIDEKASETVVTIATGS